MGGEKELAPWKHLLILYWSFFNWEKFNVYRAGVVRFLDPEEAFDVAFNYKG